MKVLGDGLALLLSSDWFLPKWASIGLSVDFDRQRLIQGAMRIETMKLLGGATSYWGISFEEDRRACTNDGVILAFLNAKVDAETVVRVRGIVDGSFLNRWGDDAWFYQSIFDKWIEVFEFDESFSDFWLRAADIKSVWNSDVFDSSENESLALNSGSSWDKFLCKLFPEMPTWLSDFASAELISRTRLDALWKLLNECGERAIPVIISFVVQVGSELGAADFDESVVRLALQEV